jgi:hypothetical protein
MPSTSEEDSGGVVGRNSFDLNLNKESLREDSLKDLHTSHEFQNQQLLDDLAIIIVPNSYLSADSLALCPVPISNIDSSERVTSTILPGNTKKPVKKELPPPPPPKKPPLTTSPEWTKLQTIFRNGEAVNLSASKPKLKRRKKILFKPPIFNRIINILLMRKIHYFHPLKTKFNILQIDNDKKKYSWVKKSDITIKPLKEFNWPNVNSDQEHDWERWELDERLVFDETLLLSAETLPKFQKITTELSRKPLKKLKPANKKTMSKRFLDTRRLIPKRLPSITKYAPDRGYMRRWRHFDRNAEGRRFTPPNNIPMSTKSTGLNLYHIDQKTFEASYGHPNFKTPYVVFVHSPVNGNKIRKIYGHGD